MYAAERQQSNNGSGSADLVNRASSGSQTTEAGVQSAVEHFESWLDNLKPLHEAEQFFTLAASPDGNATRPAVVAFEGTLHVDGFLSGSVRSEEGTLVMSETGEMEAEVRVAVAIINGTVSGDIKASKRIELGGAARVIGNIQTPALSVQPGAIFEGTCRLFEAAGENRGNSQG